MPRPKDKREMPQMAQMRQAARMFYIDKLSKAEIAIRFDVDPRKVTWLLEQAEEFGIVKITVEETGGSDLEEPLRTKFPHLQRVLIVNGPKVEKVEQYEPIFLNRAAQLAADYFDELVQAQEQKSTRPLRITITGGETLLSFSNSIKDRPRKNLYIHLANFVGRGRLQGTMHIDSIVNASVLWSHSGRIPGRCIYATVPPYKASKPGPKARTAASEELKAIADFPPVKEVLTDITVENIDVALASLGVVSLEGVEPALRDRLSSMAILRHLVSPNLLLREGAVGEIACCYFDQTGENNPKYDWHFFLSAGEYDNDPRKRGLGFYKSMVAAAKPVFVMAGPFKVPQIKAALIGKLFNVFVTDEHTARELL
jgi:DNA-binding transcriptional regulator LsrR (DeoR family)